LFDEKNNKKQLNYRLTININVPPKHDDTTT